MTKVNAATVRTDIAKAFGAQAKAGVTHRKTIAALFVKLGMYDQELRDTCHKAALMGELSLTADKYETIKATPKDRDASWKAADMRFRANWSRALGDAGLVTDEKRGGNTARKEAPAPAPVTVESMAIPTIANAADLQAFLVNVSTALNHMLAKNAKSVTGDYGTIARDAIDAFGKAVRRPIA